MKLRCKQEAINDDGTKVMQFTKGKIYDFEEIEEGCHEVKDDNGKREVFFHTGLMFEKVKSKSK